MEGERRRESSNVSLILFVNFFLFILCDTLFYFLFIVFTLSSFLLLFSHSTNFSLPLLFAAFAAATESKFDFLGSSKISRRFFLASESISSCDLLFL